MKRRNKDVWVERDENKQIIRIFHTRKCDAFDVADAAGRAVTCPRFDATRAIRDQIYKRTGGYCELDCGRPIKHSGALWERMHMHERVWRSQKDENGNFGDVSLTNSIGVCSPCHKKEHASRSPRFGETKEFEIE